MAHITNKMRIQKEKNNRSRGFNGFDTGTRDMGYSSNQERKADARLANEKKENSYWSGLLK